MAECVFCRIISGELPCWKIWEDESVLVFLDINPVTEGHTLVIPKSHAGDISGMSVQETDALARVLRKMAPAVMKAAGAQGFNILNNCGSVAGQAVEHVHFHIIPRKAGDGRGYRWITFNYDDGAGEKLAERITEAID